MKKENKEQLADEIKFVRGIDNIEQLQLWFKSEKYPVGLAFVGRSNVGKSSLLNALFGHKIAHVSKTPGRTRQINVFEFRIPDMPDFPFYAVDLPGYGHAEVSKKTSKAWDELMLEFFSNLPPSLCLLVIWDSRHPAQKKDEDFYAMVKEFRLESYLIFSKLDKLKTQKERSKFRKDTPATLKKFKKFKQVYFVSAHTKDGMEELIFGLKTYLLKRTQLNLVAHDS